MTLDERGRELYYVEVLGSLNFLSVRPKQKIEKEKRMPKAYVVAMVQINNI